MTPDQGNILLHLTFIVWFRFHHILCHSAVVKRYCHIWQNKICLLVWTVQMASAQPTTTTPLISTTSSQAYFDEISESLSQARQALDRAVRALESLDRLETIMNMREEYENSPHTTFGAQATLVEVVGEELNTLERWLEAVEGLLQRLLEDSTKHDNNDNQRCR